MRKAVLGLLLALAAFMPASAQIATVMPYPVIQFVNTNGAPLAGGLLYTCTQGGSCPGTTQLTYFDSALSTPHANPVVLDSAGRASIYLSAATYKFVLQTSAGVTVWTQDNVSSLAPYNLGSLTGKVNFQAPTTLTISGGSVTPTRNVHAIDTSGGAANLTTLNTSNVASGFEILIFPNNGGSNPVTVTTGGNISLAGGNFVMNASTAWIVLVLNGSTWYEISRSTQPGLTGFTAATQSLSIVSNVLTINYINGNVILVPFNANITTTTLQNVPPSGRFATLTIRITADGSARTWAFLTSTVNWGGTGAPTFTTTNNKADWFTLWTVDGGTTWYGIVNGQNF